MDLPVHVVAIEQQFKQKGEIDTSKCPMGIMDGYPSTWDPETALTLTTMLERRSSRVGVALMVMGG